MSDDQTPSCQTCQAEMTQTKSGWACFNLDCPDNDVHTDCSLSTCGYEDSCALPADEISARMDSKDGKTTIVAEFGGVTITLEIPADADEDKAETLLTFFPSVVQQIVVAAEQHIIDIAGGVDG